MLARLRKYAFAATLLWLLGPLTGCGSDWPEGSQAQMGGLPDSGSDAAQQVDAAARDAAPAEDLSAPDASPPPLPSPITSCQMPGVWDHDSNASTPCVSLTECPAGTYQTGAGTYYRDRTCSACRPGDYCQPGSKERATCPPETWDHDEDPATPCRAWTVCSPGTRINNYWQPDEVSDRYCTPCPNGSFSSQDNQEWCLSWTYCYGIVLQPGTDTSDVVCEDCPPGRYIAYVGNERRCTDCPDQTYNNWHNAGGCYAWLVCSPGQYVWSPGTPEQNRICQVCPTGQTSYEDNAESCVPTP